ncbi:hypothetical protein POJ06DRAFT_268344 [Lipomyces tetrasporus]|uniref:Uncharacterized protein n=1 Tax=Lipomyces tetrasporus TaxID=54092 RepID=A0AAD7VU29_9ASCO|nr:uncharacterized protein POJ06DRAFT_268344 [Lipomyces tetrasporus]KAJ8100765.1 hypothetical protein POJ06DRAFT_268344 [Lipomyces tetrasporus]
MSKSRPARPPTAGNTVIVSRARLFDSEAEESTTEVEPDANPADGLPYSTLNLEFAEKAPERQPTGGIDVDIYGDEFEFSLFSTEAKVVKIEDAPIEAPDSAQAEPVAPLVVTNKRPDSYYFVNDSDDARIQRIQSCAISGDDIIAQATMPWPGMQRPWRVMHIPAPSAATKRKKPSKKRRMILKQRAERRIAAAAGATPFKKNDTRNWIFYNFKMAPQPNLKKHRGTMKEKRAKPYKLAL